jgi:hypothetical protein
LLPYKLTISSNGGANYSISSFMIKVFPIFRLEGVIQEILIQGRLR